MNRKNFIRRWWEWRTEDPTQFAIDSAALVFAFAALFLLSTSLFWPLESLCWLCLAYSLGVTHGKSK